MRTQSKVKITDSIGSVVDLFTGPLVGYETANKEDNISGASYYGFLDVNGNWYIQKIDGNDITYIKGGSNYSDNWTARTSLTYLPFDQIF